MKMIRVEHVGDKALRGSVPWSNPFSISLPTDIYIRERQFREVRTGIRIWIEGSTTLQIEPDGPSAKEGLYVLGWRAEPELCVMVTAPWDIAESKKLSVVVTVMEKGIVPVRFFETSNGIKVADGDKEHV